MFSPDNFYNYLRYFLYHQKNSPIARSFERHGSLNLFNSNNSNTQCISPYIKDTSNTPLHFLGYCELFDQEPIDLQTIYDESSRIDNQLKFMDAKLPQYKDDILAFFKYMAHFKNPIKFISRYSSAVHTPLVCHSEQNSKDIDILKNNHYIPVYYWYHAFISLDWFRHYKFLNINYNLTNHKFGIYARDASGTRKYRLSLLNNISDINDSVYFNLVDPIKSQDTNLSKFWNTTTNSISSDNSAIIDWLDTEIFDIQIVVETLYNSKKIHLTEKIFKPIVMGQPFILASSSHSLKYIQNYGFKTFNSLWDESYDNELDDTHRLMKINELIHNINNLPKNKYRTIIYEAKKICAFNRQYFFSNKFEQLLLQEMQTNISNALHIRKDQFYNFPGGTYFSLLNDSYQKNIIIPPHMHTYIRAILDYMNVNYPSIANQIIKQYNHLI